MMRGIAAPRPIAWNRASLLQAAWLGLSLVGLAALAFLLLNFAATGSDTRSYHGVDLANPYAAAVGNLSAPIAFRYAPPLALVIAPLGALSYAAFHVLWLGIALSALAVTTGRWTLAMIALYPVLLELSVGNVHLLLAAALVYGLRWPALWSFLVLTKVTPGVVFLWFAARGEWRKLAIALLATALVSGVSYVIAPHLWPLWLDMLSTNVGAPAGVSVPVPLAVRLPLAAILVFWGARTDRPWTLAVALLLSIPTIWPHAFAVLVAAVPLRNRR